MSPKQKKIAAKAPPPNKIDEKDFAVLRAEKAKGRGMGLQDEKVQPGKVMKAKRGTGVLTEKGTSKTFAGYSKPFEGPQSKGRVSTITGVKPRAKIIGQRKKFKSLEEMRKAKGFKMIGGKQETSEQFNRRTAREGRAARAAKALGTRGKIALGVGMAGVGAVQYLKSKMKKKDEPKKKMGGGMMKKYNKGGGADTGNVGEMRSKLGVLSGKLKKAGMRLTERDLEKVKEILKKTPRGQALNITKRTIDVLKSSKKMGGGMMKRPMGYKTGGGFDAGTPGKLRDLVTRLRNRKPYNPNPGGATRPIKKSRKEKVISAGKKAAEVLVKTTPLGAGVAAAQTIKKIMSKKKEKSDKTGGASKRGSVDRTTGFKRAPMIEASKGGFKPASPSQQRRARGSRQLTRQQDTRKRGPVVVTGGGDKPIIYLKVDPITFGKDGLNMPKGMAPKKMGGGMMNKPMGYKSGKSIKVKCKLGRSKPTKMY